MSFDMDFAWRDPEKALPAEAFWDYFLSRSFYDVLSDGSGVIYHDPYTGCSFTPLRRRRSFRSLTSILANGFGPSGDTARGGRLKRLPKLLARIGNGLSSRMWRRCGVGIMR